MAAFAKASSLFRNLKNVLIDLLAFVPLLCCHTCSHVEVIKVAVLFFVFFCLQNNRQEVVEEKTKQYYFCINAQKVQSWSDLILYLCRFVIWIWISENMTFFSLSVVAFFHKEKQWKCMTNSCLFNRFSHICCGSPQLLWSCHRPFNLFSH